MSSSIQPMGQQVRKGYSEFTAGPWVSTRYKSAREHVQCVETVWALAKAERGTRFHQRCTTSKQTLWKICSYPPFDSSFEACEMSRLSLQTLTSSVVLLSQPWKERDGSEEADWQWWLPARGTFMRAPTHTCTNLTEAAGELDACWKAQRQQSLKGGVGGGGGRCCFSHFESPNWFGVGKENHWCIRESQLAFHSTRNHTSSTSSQMSCVIN